MPLLRVKAYMLTWIVDSDLKLPSAVRSSTIKPGFVGSECSIDLTSATDGEKTSYKGMQKRTKDYALIFDPATQAFTLERIDTDFAFGNGRTSPDNQSEDGIINTLIDQEGAADVNNPYDWRHQLKRQRTPTPELEPFDPLGIDTLRTRTPTPEHKPMKPRPKPRKASTPPEEPVVELGASPSPEPEQESLQREEEEDEEENEGDSDDGGLQIVMDGAVKPKNRFRGRFNQGMGLDAPISLRSAASSQSPAMRHDGGSDESDEDVDEMTLGSPMTERRKDSGLETEPQLTDEPTAEQEDIDMEDELDAEFARAMEGIDEDEPTIDGTAAPVTTYVDDSSSESEEE